jgi:hypothetical protein
MGLFQGDRLMASVLSICSGRSLVLATGMVTVLFVSAPTGTSGQSVAEAAGASSVAGGAATSMKVPSPKMPTTADVTGGTSPHLIASSGPPPQETNVREFQRHAGKDASKVLLRSTPVDAQIWIDDKIVGKTPMLLVLAPGKYQVEMRGARGESGTNIVDLLPHETREVVVKLHQLYPSRVTAQQ